MYLDKRIVKLEGSKTSIMGLTFPGNHVSIFDFQLQDYIVPYLVQPSELSFKQVP